MEGNIINTENEKSYNALNMDFLNMQEKDRQRIARDLHDTSLQNLTHLIHKIELSSMYIDKDPVRAKLELSIIGKRLRETIDEIRGIIFDLRPMTFDDLGLKAALENLLINLCEEGDYQIVSDIEDVSCENNLIMVSIYRLAQEAIQNVRKHANADKIIFRCMKKEDRCILEIEDNGDGFAKLPDDENRHFGVLLMKERVNFLSGEIDIVSKENEGTKVHISIPLKN